MVYTSDLFSIDKEVETKILNKHLEKYNYKLDA